MLFGKAHTVTQQSRLAITLAWVAGYTNVVTIISCGVVTSHVSGTTSNLGHDVAGGNWSAAATAFLLVFSFFLGAMASAAATEAGRRRYWESIFVLPMILEIAFLAIFAVGLESLGGALEPGSHVSVWLASTAALAMGIQNATITHISSGVVRTTHVTGVVTDLGLESTQYLLWLWDNKHLSVGRSFRSLMRSARHHPSPKRLFLLASIIGSFALGAGLGTLLYADFARWVMFPPVLFLIWIVYADLKQPIMEIELHQMEFPQVFEGVHHRIAVYQLRAQAEHAGKKHNLPNLGKWVKYLPPTHEIIILWIGTEAHIYEQTFEELLTATKQMRASGRRLLVAGIEMGRARRLAKSIGRFNELGDVFPDLEAALAEAAAQTGVAIEAATA